MASSRSIGTLAELLLVLPKGHWFKVHEKNANDSGVSKATGTSRTEIEALLINAGICRETAGGNVQFLKKGWESFANGHLPDGVQIGVKGSTRYVGRGQLTHPPTQAKRSSFNTPELTSELKEKIRQSTDKYNEKKEAEKKAEAEKKRLEDEAKAEADARAMEAKAKAEAERVERSAEYPYLSQFVVGGDINLNNPEVKQLVDEMLPDISRLYQQSGQGTIPKRPRSPSNAANAGDDEFPGKKIKTSKTPTNSSSTSATVPSDNDHPMEDLSEGTDSTSRPYPINTAEPTVMDDGNPVGAAPALITPTNSAPVCCGIACSEKNLEAYGELVFQGIRNMAAASKQRRRPKQMEDVLDSKNTARGFIGKAGGGRVFVVHEVGDTGEYTIRASTCTDTSSLTSSGACAKCLAMSSKLGNVISQTKASMAIRQQPAKATARLDLVVQHPEWSRKTIEDLRDRERALKIRVRVLELENLKLLRKGESIISGEDGKTKKSIDNIVTTICLANPAAKDKLKGDEAGAIEWAAHATAAAAHKARNGSMKGYKYSPKVLRFAISICEQMGGQVYDKVCEMFLIPKRRYLQDRKSKIRKGLGDGSGILSNAYELQMEHIEREWDEKKVPNEDRKIDWVTAYDAMYLKEGVFYDGDAIVGIDEVEDFDIVLHNFKAEPSLKKHRFIIACFNMSTTTTNRIDHILECIDNTLILQKSTRDIIKVYDGAGENASYRTRHAKTSAADVLGPEVTAHLKKVAPHVNFDFKVAKTTPDGRRMWFLEDWCHVVKRLRNALEISSHAHYKKVTADGKRPRNLHDRGSDGTDNPMNLKMLEHAKEADDHFSNGLQIAYKLKREHFHPEGNKKLNVQLAVQVLSSMMVALLERVQAAKPDHIGTVKPEQYERLKEFCLHADLFVEVMSGDMEGGIVTPDNKELFISSLLQVLEWFSKWKEDAGDDESRFLADDTWEGVQSICMTVICLIYDKVVWGGESLNLKSLETDCVENHFNHCRQKSGGSQAVTVMSANRSALASFIVRNWGSKKGNNGGAGEVSALGVNEACRRLETKDASRDKGTNRLIGASLLSALESARDSDDRSIPTKADWGSTDSQAVSSRPKQITFDQKADVWRVLQQSDSVSIDQATINRILQSQSMAEVTERHQLSAAQISRQIKNFVEEEKQRRTMFESIVQDATAAASANADGSTVVPISNTATVAPAASGQGSDQSQSTGSEAPSVPKVSKNRTPFSAQLALNDLFIARKMNDRDSIPSNDAEVLAIMDKYKIDLNAAKTELKHWRKRGGQYTGTRLEDVDRDKVQRDMIDKLQIGPDQIALHALIDVCSGKSKAVSPYKVPIDKLGKWRKDITGQIAAIMAPDSPATRDKVLQFWTNVVIGLYTASVDDFAYAAEDREKMAKRYQSDIIAYFILQQFTDLAKHGGKDNDYVIEVKLNDFTVLTPNANKVLYYLSGWVIKGVSSKNVRKDLKQTYEAFKHNNNLTKTTADECGLPTDIVELRRKRKGATLIYASSAVFSLLKNMEVVYRKHGNEAGFDRYGGQLFQYIERAVLESDGMYELFKTCLGKTICAETVKRKIFGQVVAELNHAELRPVDTYVPTDDIWNAIDEDLQVLISQ